MFINGCKVNAPASAVTALRHLRLRDIPRVLWIDALCINQDDVKERESQVTMMGKIYQSASRTVVWLGEADKDSETAIQTIEGTAKQMPQHLRGLNFSEWKMSDYKKPLPPTTLDLNDTAAIFRRPWFTRLWVFQEVALSTSCVVQIGSFTFDWEDLELFAAYHITNGSRFSHPDLKQAVRGAVDLRIVRLGKETRSMSALVRATRMLLTSNPRDNIYGLLGLAKADLTTPRAQKILPNYTAPVHDCITNAVRFMIEETGNLESIVDRPSLILRSHFEDNELRPWPSWCPRYDRPRSKDHRRKSTNRFSHKHNADGRVRLKLKGPTPTSHSDDLCVGGIPFATVSEILSNFGNETGKVVIAVRRIMDSMILPSQNDEMALMFMTMLAGMYSHEKLSMDSDRFRALLESFREAESLTRESQVQHADSKTSPEYEKVLETIISTCFNRCLFTTDNGALGLGPRDMQEKDQIAVLFGMAWPVVLRPRVCFWEFIQPCYIHDIMDGEAVQKWEATGEEAEFFVLR